MDDWVELFKMIMSGGAGYAIDQNNAKNMIQPKDAAAQVSGRYDALDQRLNDTMAGKVPAGSPLEAARTGWTSRMNTPVKPPAASFNPYQQNPNYGNPADLFKQAQGLVPQRSQGVQQGSASLFDMLKRRMTPRPMGG